MTWPSTRSSKTRSSQAGWELGQEWLQARAHEGNAVCGAGMGEAILYSRIPAPNAGLPGPHQARTRRPAPGTLVWSKVGFPTLLFQAFCALFGPKESGDEAVTLR